MGGVMWTLLKVQVGMAASEDGFNAIIDVVVR